MATATKTKTKTKTTKEKTYTGELVDYGRIYHWDLGNGTGQEGDQTNGGFVITQEMLDQALAAKEKKPRDPQTTYEIDFNDPKIKASLVKQQGKKYIDVSAYERKMGRKRGGRGKGDASIPEGVKKIEKNVKVVDEDGKKVTVTTTTCYMEDGIKLTKTERDDEE